MADFTPASGDWIVGYDEFGTAVRYDRRNQDARQLPPPPPPLSSLSPRRGNFVPEAHYAHFPPGPHFTPSARLPAEFPPLVETSPPETQNIPGRPGNGPPPFPPNNFMIPVVAPQTPPPTLLSSTKREEEAKHWIKKRNANGDEYFFNTLTMERQMETPDCLKKYTTK